MELKHAKQLYYSDREDFIKIALEYFDKEQLEKAALPTSWEDLSSAQIKAVKIAPKEIHALHKLKDLLKAYNGDWVAKHREEKRYIINYDGKQPIKDRSFWARLLEFKTEEKRDHFLTHHLALIKQAAPLLWGVSFEEEKKEVKRTGYLLGHQGQHSGTFEIPSTRFSKLETALDYPCPSLSSAKKDLKVMQCLVLATIYTDGTHLLEDIENAADEEQ